MLLIVHVVLATAALPLMAVALIGRWVTHGKSFGQLVGASLGCALGAVVSGGALVVIDHLNITAACLQGSFYLLVLGIAFAGYQKLAAVTD